MGGAEGTKLDVDFVEMERVRKINQLYLVHSISVGYIRPVCNMKFVDRKRE